MYATIVRVMQRKEEFMTSRHQVRCVIKSDRQNAHERITHIGGNDNGSAWRITQAQAIEGIESRKWSFYVSQNGRTVDVIVATGRNGNKYIKTVADGDQPNNLLSLPSCT
jgi:hypothetical protein